MTYPIKKLGEICDILDSKRRPVTKSDRKAGPYPYYGATGVQDYVADYIFDEPLVLVGEDGANWEVGANSAYKVDGKCWVNNHAHVLRPRRDVVLDDWLTYFLNMSDLTPFLTGTTVKKLNQERLRAIEIPLSPLAEQREIVSKIEKQFAKIDEVARLRADSEALAEKLLPAALHKIFSSAESKGWEQVDIGDEKIMQMTSGGTPSRSNSSFYGGKIAWLKSGELNDNVQIEDSKEHITDEALKKSSAKVFPAGTVLLAMYGATAGKLGVLAKPATTNQAVAGIIPNAKSLDSKFLYYCLTYIREQIIEQAWGGAQPNLSQTILKTFKIPFPSLAEQKKIVKKLDVLSEKARMLRDLQSSQSVHLKSLKQSVLHEAFDLA